MRDSIRVGALLRHGARDGVGSGTDALQLAIRACGVSSGDEVITVSHTFFATVEAIVYANARPILVDVDERTMLMDIGSVASRITPRTKAIVPVHLYGRTVDLKPLRQLAQGQGHHIIEAPRKQHGALLDDGKRDGTGGRVNCFLFYCSRISARTGGGSITTNDEKLADDLRALREHGQSTRYYHRSSATNARLDEIQARSSASSCGELDQWNARRQEIAARYNELLSGGDIITPEIPRAGVMSLLLRDPRTRRQARCASRHLAERGIGTQIQLPGTDPHAGRAQFLGYRKGDMPVTEKVAGEVLSAADVCGVTDAQIDRVGERRHGVHAKAEGLRPVATDARERPPRPATR